MGILLNKEYWNGTSWSLRFVQTSHVLIYSKSSCKTLVKLLSCMCVLDRMVVLFIILSRPSFFIRLFFHLGWWCWCSCCFIFSIKNRKGQNRVESTVLQFSCLSVWLAWFCPFFGLSIYLALRVISFAPCIVSVPFQHAHTALLSHINSLLSKIYENNNVKEFHASC